VQIVTLSEGEITELHIGLKGTMNDECAIPEGPRRQQGEPIRGERTVNQAQADIVRRVFRAFAAGISPRAIARRMNDEGASSMRASSAAAAADPRLCLMPGAKRGEIAAPLHGELGTILDWTAQKQNTPGAFASGVSVSLVAGVGFEPTTFRL
jgi:hypothetical protein